MFTGLCCSRHSTHYHFVPVFLTKSKRLTQLTNLLDFALSRQSITSVAQPGLKLLDTRNPFASAS